MNNLETKLEAMRDRYLEREEKETLDYFERYPDHLSGACIDDVVCWDKDSKKEGFNALLPVVLELAEALEFINKPECIHGHYSLENNMMQMKAHQALKNLSARLEK